MLKNPEAKRELIIIAAVSAMLTAVFSILDKRYAAVSAVCSAAFICIWIVISRIRYRRIAKLSQSMDEVLHGKSIPEIGSFCEGELSVLENELHKLLLSYREQNQRLAAEKVKLSDSLADISHQLRTPLTSMNLMAGLLSVSEISDDRRLRIIGELSSTLNSTEELVDMLLKIARLDAGADTLERGTVSVKDCVDEAVGLLSVMSEIRDVRLEVGAREGEFTGDRKWTVQALVNLIKNCIEHSPSGGTVNIECTDTPVFAGILISDSGGGFSEEDMAHLFERFYRGKDRGSSGCGIGLSLANVIVRKQNGSLKAYNRDGGACFDIRFYKENI